MLNESVTFTAKVTFTGTAGGHTAGEKVTEGRVKFGTGGNAQCLGSFNELQANQNVDSNGQVTYTTSTLPAGDTTIRACFTNPGAGSTGAGDSVGSVTQKVNAVTATSVSDITASTSTFGGTTNLSAKVSPSGAPGSVAFFVNGSSTAASGTVNYDSSTGVATLSNYSHGLNANATPYSVKAVFTPSGSSFSGSDANNASALTVNKAPGSVSINNIPANAVFGGSFTPSYTKAGDGQTSVTSLTTATCTVNNTTGVVSFAGAGTCTLRASVAEGTNHLAATGSQQSFGIGFNFVGFTAPVDNTNSYMNVLKAGQAIPLKWRLTDANSQPVTNLAAVTVTAKTLSCSIGATDDLMEEVAAGGSGLQNLGSGYYQFNWASPKSYASSCKTLHLDLGEKDATGNAVTHTAQFKFNK
jgi:hypothetical protein